MEIERKNNNQPNRCVCVFVMEFGLCASTIEIEHMLETNFNSQNHNISYFIKPPLCDSEKNRKKQNWIKYTEKGSNDVTNSENYSTKPFSTRPTIHNWWSLSQLNIYLLYTYEILSVQNGNVYRNSRNELRKKTKCFIFLSLLVSAQSHMCICGAHFYLFRSFICKVRVISSSCHQSL